MICPNCKSNIPDDSKFCPDCGTTVVNIEELRTKAKEITIQYKKGYDFLANVGSLPYITYNMTAEACNKIISAKSELEKKQREIENKEKREIESSLHLEASNIYYLYTNAYNYFVSYGVLPSYSTTGGMSIEDYKKIIAKKNDIIRKHQEIEDNENRLAEGRRKEEERRYILSEVNRLGITNQDVINMFLDNPDRLKSDYWRNWVKNNPNGYTESSKNKTDDSNTAVIVTIIGFILVACLLAYLLSWNT